MRFLVALIIIFSLMPTYASADENMEEFEKEQLANEIQVDENALEISDHRPCKIDPRDSCDETRKERRERIRKQIRAEMNQEKDEEIIFLCIFQDIPPLRERFCSG